MQKVERDQQIIFKVTDKEKNKMKSYAKKTGLSLSEFIRNAVMKAIKEKETF